MPDGSHRARYRHALDRQRAERDLERQRATQTVDPRRITAALDLAGLYGPDVDRALGGEEPMVDEWEAGTRVPTRAQIDALAELTCQPVAFFYQKHPEVGDGWLCGDHGCARVTTPPDPRVPAADPVAPVIPLRGRRA